MVEDVEEDASLLVLTLEQSGYAVSPRRVETSEALRAALEEQSWDLLTSAHFPPGFSAPDAVALARSLCPDLPIVIVADAISPRLAAELLRDGARSYLPKENISVLPPVVDRELRAAVAERQRRMAEAALRESEARWQAALEGAGEGVWDWNLQTGEIFFSRQWKALLGYAEDEVITLAMWEALVHPDDHQRVMATDPALHNGLRTTIFGEYRILCKDGAYKWIQDRGKVISFTPEGKPLRAIGTQTDITQRKETEAQFQSVVENAPWGMHFFQLTGDRRLIFTGANPVADDILGVRHAGLLGQALEAAFPQFTATEIPRRYREVAERGTAWHSEQIGYVNGQIASAYAIHAFQTAPGRMVAVFENILERKRAEEIIQAQAEALRAQNQELRLQNQELTAQGEALHRTEIELRASEEKYRALIETTDTGYIIVDAGGRVLDANAEYLRLTGRQSADEILGHPVTEWTAPHDRERNAREVRTCLEEGFVRNLEIDYVDPEGRLIPVEINATTLSTGDSPVIVGLARDIAERKEAEQTLRASEQRYRQLNRDLEGRVAERTRQLESANLELEAFAYSVSHDLRAPLRVINGYATILQQDYLAHLPEEAQRCLRGARINTLRMEQLIDDLLAFSRLSRQPLDKRPVQPARLAQEALDDLAAERAGRQIEIALDRLPECHADPALLRQVFANLLSNAIKYTRGREPARIEIGARQEAGQTVYYIKDNGAGFDMKDASQLFGVFQRLHSADDFEGTGIGLANVQRIVQRHGGRVWAEAEADQGATFYFTLEEARP